MDPKVLLVEDNADDQYLVKRAVKKYAPTVSLDVAWDGESALKYFSDHREDPPHLVLLDIKLPKLSGLDVLCRVRRDEAFAKLPIVILSSSNEPIDLARADECGANEYVQKPFDFTVHAETVRDILKRYLEL